MNKNIKIEVVDLYVMYGKPGMKMTYSAHVYVKTPDVELDIRGYTVHVHSQDDRSKDHVYPPMQTQYDREEKKRVLFPVLNTNIGEWEDEMKKLILEEARKRFAKPERLPGLPTSFNKYVAQGKKPVLPKFQKPGKPKSFSNYPPKPYKTMVRK